MEASYLQFVTAWVSILGVTLTAFGVLYFEMNRRFKRAEERSDEKFKAAEKRSDEKFKAAEERSDERFASLTALIHANFKTVDANFKTVDEKLKTVDANFKTVDETLADHGRQLTSLREGVARIEGHLGYGFAGGRERGPEEGEPPEQAA